MSSTQLILYFKPGCPWCDVAQHYLDKHGYKYERIDVRRGRAAFDDLKRISNQTSTPTLVFGSLVLPDFGLDELEEFLKEHNILP